MGKIKHYELEKLVIGIMYVSPQKYMSVVEKLTELFGNIDSISDEYSFSDFSSFYNTEMHGNVLKRFISFEKLVDPSNLSEIKITTNNVESLFASENGDRNVNIDPCLLSHGKFVMATTKNASFRVAHEKGIYIDLSLVYSRKHWVDFFWTYFDVRSKLIKNYLERVRTIYLLQRNKEN